MILSAMNSNPTNPPRRIETQGADRRRTHRAPADFTVEIETTDRERWRAWAVDIGIGGMFIETDAVPAYGSAVLITIGDPPLAQSIQIPATVRWSALGGFGVEFGLLGIRETHALVALTTELSRFEEEAVTVMRMHLCS